ncbi:MAG TPA: DUF6079 family protein [Abditibacteriaceae bacterium]|jgi:hypothetical protein
MTIGELIEVRRFPAVVQAADVRDLRASSHRVLRGSSNSNASKRDTSNEALHDFIGGYVGFDERARHAVDVAVRSLAGGQGGGFFFNGVFGSGKSHLLGLLALLCDGLGHDTFATTHNPLASVLQNFAPRLTVYFSLDEYSAQEFSLEEIFWRELRDEWQRHGFTAGELQIPAGTSRGEAFAALEDLLAAKELSGLAVFVDELSLFLSGREHRALQNDAAFLQFLGQRARRNRTAASTPLWVFAALQKTVDDIGDLDAYALSQIRDRFTTLPLSLAHLPSLIERRLIVRRNTQALHQLCGETYERLLRALPRLDFGREEWQRLYPFHPATVALLEQVAARYGSRTRSAAVFCAQSVHAGNDATQRVLADALFDHFEPELQRHPDLKLLQTVWKNWLDNEAQIAQAKIARDSNEAATMRVLMKALLLWKIAGAAPSVVQLANALALDAKLPGDGNYEYCQILLEKMRTQGSGIALERREGEFADRYSIDVGARVGEMARRFTHNVLHTLPPHDSRIAAYALQCCRDEALPLAALQNAASTQVMWRNVPRGVRIQLLNIPPTSEALANQLAMLASFGQTDDWLLCLVPPFSAAEESDSLAERWRNAAREALQTLHDARWRGALVWWLPRSASADEWQQAREATAQHLLLSDIQLQDNRRGRAVLEHLKNGLPEREAALSRIAMRALHEGTISTGSGAVIDAADLAGRENWNATLEAIAEFALPQVFPQFGRVAPRLRVLTPSNADALCLEILRRPAEKPFFSANIERIARAVGEPLGIAAEAAGRWKIATVRAELAQEISSLANEGITLSALEAQLRKGVWGLAEEQTRVAACAMLRSGELTAFDARGAALSANEIGMPLRRSMHSLRRGQLLDESLWQRLHKLLSLLDIAVSREQTFAAQEQARAGLIAWCDHARSETELAQARLHQLRRAWGQTPAQWPQSEAALEAMVPVLRAFATEGVTNDVLTQIAQCDVPVLQDALSSWRTLLENLESRHARLVAAYNLLNHPDLVLPGELQNKRMLLLARFDDGERVLDDEELLPQFARWKETYESQYLEWHATQHNPARWSVYRRLVATDAARALQKLASLSSRPFAYAGQLQESANTEFEKMCGRNGSLHGEPLCSACRLHLGERLVLRDPHELEAIVTIGIAALHTALQETSVREFLSRQSEHEASALLQWNGEIDTLLPLLTDNALRVLNEAFRPRRCITRSWQQLRKDVQACRTRREWRQAMLSWLDADENLADDDEIELKD